MAPIHRHVLRRYAIPAGLWIAACIAGSSSFYLAGLIGVPVAALWLFWLIAHEPPVQRFSQKAARIAAILLILLLPLAMFIGAIYVVTHDDEGIAAAIAVLAIGPFAAIQIVAGAVALWWVTRQKLASSLGPTPPAPLA
ncbi:hypothetical protein [Phenylobacterium sp.]|uniref:hypothetical protein n=1 Tax=Phenylobacterium sp. TaxID=1871053 RepID=UPI0030F3B72D